MSTTRSVETTGPSIEEAIQAGLDELKVSRESVIVEIIEEPSRGLLGLGAREAVVRLTTAARPRDDEATPPPAPAPAATDTATASPAPPTRRRDAFTDLLDAQAMEEEQSYASTDFSVRTVEDDGLPEDAQVGKATLERILQLMDMDVYVTGQIAGSSAEDDQTIVLQIEGEELGNLIGRKGDTLSTLQYLTRLITSQQLQRRVNFVIDAGGYKSKREETLRKLANRTANRAVERGRTIKLDPMPAHERRIIHMTLRNRDDVDTRSEGEGNYRKVTIIPR